VRPSTFSSPGSKNGAAAGRQQLDLALVDVDAEHLMAQVGHAGRVHGSEIAGTDNGKAHGHSRQVDFGPRASGERCRSEPTAPFG
jgi:hypothetical protein